MPGNKVKTSHTRGFVNFNRKRYKKSYSIKNVL
jgi:hypothetical protein